MLLPTILLAALALAGQAEASFINAGDTPNRFMVTYAPVPTFGKKSFYSMPRNWNEAGNMGFFKIHDNWDQDKERTEVWCRMNDYRVCVLFDTLGSAAGIQLAVNVEDMASSPLDISGTPEWRRDTLLNHDVYIARVYFVNKDVIEAGGRKDLWQKEGLTIADGIHIQQWDSTGKPTGTIHVPADESGAEAVGFHEQSCFIGMGKHYFQGLTKESSCEKAKPYFTLYNKKTHKLQGFGFTVYGKSSLQNRGWFETPPAAAAKLIAPNSPPCMTEWINKYGMFTMHVFFVDKPWLSCCL